MQARARAASRTPILHSGYVLAEPTERPHLHAAYALAERLVLRTDVLPRHGEQLFFDAGELLAQPGEQRLPPRKTYAVVLRKHARIALPPSAHLVCHALACQQLRGAC